jgi:nitroreductase
MSIDNGQLEAAFNWRYATKKFDAARKIGAADWATLEASLVLAPSSYGLQPWKFLVITDAALRERMVEVSWNQRQVADCSHYVVFAVKRAMDHEHVDRYLARIAEVRGGAADALAGYRQMMVSDVVEGERGKAAMEWAARQAYIALGGFMAAAALLGIDTCPMEGFDPAKYDAMLGLPERGLAAVVACAAGYRAADDKYATLAKVRFPADQVIERIG